MGVGGIKMLTFEPFRIWMVKNNKKRQDIIDECKLSPPTATRIMKDQFPVKTDLIDTLCSTYGLRIEEVIEHRKDVKD